MKTWKRDPVAKTSFLAQPWLLGLIWLLGTVKPAFTQQYLSQQGHLLDANTRIGSMGLNTGARLDALMPRVDLYITGNITGGARFQGLVPYRSPHEFGGASVGSADLSDFRRDSTGYSDLVSTGVGGPQPYLDPSRQVTRGFGSAVFGTDRLYKQPVTPRGVSLGRLLGEGLEDYNNLSVRPLSQSYSPLNVSSALTAPNPFYEKPSYLRTGQRQPWRVEEPSQLARSAPAYGEHLLEQPALERAGQGFQQAQLPGIAESESSPAASQEKGLRPYQLGTEPSGTGDVYEEVAQRLEELNALAQTEVPPEERTAGSLPQQPPPLPSETGVSSLIGPGPEPTMVGPPLGGAGLTTLPKKQLSESERKQFNYYLRRGEELLQQGHYYRAANAFESAILFAPRDPVACVAKAHALLGAGELMSSAFFLDKAFELSPNLAKTQIDIRRFFPNPEDFEKRMNDIDRWQQRTGQPMLLFLKGYVLYQIAEYEQAERALTESLRAQPGARSVQYLLDAVHTTLKTSHPARSDTSAASSGK